MHWQAWVLCGYSLSHFLLKKYVIISKKNTFTTKVKKYCNRAQNHQTLIQTVSLNHKASRHKVTEYLQFVPGWVLANPSQVMCKTQQGDNDALFLLRITESDVRRPRLELSPLSDLWIAHASVFSKCSHFWSINQILLFARVCELKRHYRSWNSNNTFQRFREIRAFMG